MKKRNLLLISLLILAVLIGSVNYIYQEESKRVITGETITGNATSGSLAVAVSVVVESPGVSLLYPENKTYITDKNLKLNYTSSNAHTVWYNLDNLPNATLTGNSTFNTSSGQHIVYIYANNTNGELATENISFNANTTKLKINFQGLLTENSTNLNQTSYEDLQNISEVVLERSNHGKIKFNSRINLTNDSNPGDNEIDLDSNINISDNLIEINTTALPNLNVSATLYLYDLTFSDPRILLDGSVCPSEVCTKINYSGGTLVFNVTHFSAYSSEETPTTATVTSSGGGGGSSGGSSTFDLDKTQLSVSLSQGEIKTQYITINNTGGQTTDFKIQNGLGNLAVINESSFSLPAGQSKKISIDFIARENTLTDLYLGKITVSGGGISKEIFTSIEVESATALLDVNVEIPEAYKSALAGGKITAGVKLFNLGELTGRTDINIEYSLRDYDGNEIYRGTESIAIETQTTFVKTIQLPENTPTGKYILYVKASYNGKTAGASDTFEVVSRTVTANEKVYIIIIIALCVVLSLIIYLSIIHYTREHPGKNRKKGERIQLRNIVNK